MSIEFRPGKPKSFTRGEANPFTVEVARIALQKDESGEPVWSEFTVKHTPKAKEEKASDIEPVASLVRKLRRAAEVHEPRVTASPVVESVSDTETLVSFKVIPYTPKAAKAAAEKTPEKPAETVAKAAPKAAAKPATK